MTTILNLDTATASQIRKEFKLETGIKRITVDSINKFLKDQDLCDLSCERDYKLYKTQSDEFNRESYVYYATYQSKIEIMSDYLRGTL